MFDVIGQNSMRNELFGGNQTTLGASFETYEDVEEEPAASHTAAGSTARKMRVKDVDLERNMVKYLLESHAAQLGRGGPVSLLMSQLGISLPRPPRPNLSGETSDSDSDGRSEDK